MSARQILTATAVLSLGVLGACSATAGNKPAANETPTPVAIQKQADTLGTTVKLTVAAVGNLGQVLTDANGLTLYRFDKDTAKPPKSNCDGDCATAWPPVMATGSVEVQGVDAQLVGSVIRSDGSQQVTVAGWPVYRYAKDTAAGEATGQGVGGTWAAVTPTGGKAGAAAKAPASEAKTTAINTTNIPGLDTVLTDQDGKTLYLFTKDSKKPSKSNCDGACATAWPPLLEEGSLEISGIDPKLVGTVVRADGTKQVTVGGWPVYRYAKDTAPGQATGHAVGGTWFEIETNGCKVADDKKPTNASASATPSTASGGY